MRPLALSLVVALLTVSGCGGDDEPSKSAPIAEGTPMQVATVQGRLVAVEGSEETALPGTVTLKGADGSIVNAEIGEDGSFQVQTSAGRYRISGRSPEFADGKRDCVPAEPVTTLVLGETVSVDVVCQRR